MENRKALISVNGIRYQAKENHFENHERAAGESLDPIKKIKNANWSE